MEKRKTAVLKLIYYEKDDKRLGKSSHCYPYSSSISNLVG